MAVHQVEEYYTHVSTATLSEKDKRGIIKMLIENNWDDYEFGCDYLVVDGFESGAEALMCDEMINKYLVEA